jgi:hypothetical protein
MKTVLQFLAITFFASLAGAQQMSASAEVMCRAQAKEMALQTYNGCITTARNNQIEQIRADYKKEMAELKGKYDKELKKLSAGSAAGKKAAKNKANPVTVKEVSAAKLPKKTTKGIATQLPGRNEAIEAPPVQHINEGTAVVATAPEAEHSSDSAIEAEAAQAEQIEMIEMPVE